MGWIGVSEVSEDVNVFFDKVFDSWVRVGGEKKHDFDDATSLNYGVAFCPLNFHSVFEFPALVEHFLNSVRSIYNGSGEL